VKIDLIELVIQLIQVNLRMMLK